MKKNLKILNLNGIDDSNINDSKSHICSSFEPFENIISGIQLYKKSIIRSLIIFKKLSRMTNDSLSNYISTHSSGHHQTFFQFQIF